MKNKTLRCPHDIQKTLPLDAVNAGKPTDSTHEPQADKDREVRLENALKEMLELHDRLMKKVDWSKSFLDSETNVLMNSALLNAKAALAYQPWNSPLLHHPDMEGWQNVPDLDIEAWLGGGK